MCFNFCNQDSVWRGNLEFYKQEQLSRNPCQGDSSRFGNCLFWFHLIPQWVYIICWAFDCLLLDGRRPGLFVFILTYREANTWKHGNLLDLSNVKSILSTVLISSRKYISIICDVLGIQKNLVFLHLRSRIIDSFILNLMGGHECLRLDWVY